MVDALRRDATVVTLATHSLSIGEHGLCTGMAPLAPCATSFCCASVPVVSDSLRLSTLFRDVMSACGYQVPESGGSVMGSCIARLPWHGDDTNTIDLVLRVTLPLRGHVYACILRWPSALCRQGRVHLPFSYHLEAVFDRHMDPNEEHNLMGGSIVHLEEQLRRLLDPCIPMRVCIGKTTVTTTTRTQPRSTTLEPARPPAPRRWHRVCKHL